MKKLFLIICLVSVCNVFAELEDYFKKIINKPTSNDQQIKHIDFIYLINLDQRPEKFESCKEQLQPYGISPYRFSAVNGWELSLDDLNNLGVKYELGMPTDLWGTSYLPDQNFEPHHEIMHVIGRNYFCHCMTRGAIGIVLSHLSILQDAYDSGYETIWVMEDDIQIIQNPHLLSELIEKLDQAVGMQNWDILFTDQDTKDQKGNYVVCQSYARKPNFFPQYPTRFAKRKVIGSNFIKIGARYGAYSMIIRRSGMKKILDFIKNYRIFLPYDMEYYLPNDIHLYSLINDVVSTQPRALSDNGAPNYQH